MQNPESPRTLLLYIYMESAGDPSFFLFFHRSHLILPNTETGWAQISEIILKDHKPSYLPNPSKKKKYIIGSVILGL